MLDKLGIYFMLYFIEGCKNGEEFFIERTTLLFSSVGTKSPNSAIFCVTDLRSH